MTKLNKLLILSNILLLLMCLFFLNKLGGVNYLAMAMTAKSQGELRMNGFIASTRHWKSAFVTFEIPADAIVFTGDSITRGVDWAEVIPDKKIINRAIGGIGIDELLRVVECCFVGQPPKKIFIMIGINDLKKDRPIAVYMEKYAALLTLLKSKYPQAQLYIESILPINPEIGKVVLGESVGNTDNDEITAVNTQLKTLALAHQYTFIDLYPLFLENGVLSEKYSLDGLHLNGQAALVWKNAILEYLN